MTRFHSYDLNLKFEYLNEFLSMTKKGDLKQFKNVPKKI